MNSPSIQKFRDGVNRNKLEEYATAVAACVQLAQHGTGDGTVMAQVLLSAKNGDSFQLDLTSLCNLDSTNYTMALAVAS